MPLAKAATIPTRKRNRKRKRRAASSSSSSASSSSSSSEDESPQVTTIPVPTKIIVQQDSSDSESDSSSSSSSSSSASSESSSSVRSTGLQAAATTHALPKPKRRDSHSPSPPPTALPSFLPPSGTEGSHKREEELRARFRSFWMASVADGFRADLEELHKVSKFTYWSASEPDLIGGRGMQEPNLTGSRLSLLIDSLASGADVFMSGPSGTSRGGLESISGINEMEVVLDGTT
ncbi:Ribosome-assembly protein 3, partial [Rhizoctonia solani]